MGAAQFTDTLATALTNVRDHIDEPAAAYWTDTEVQRAIIKAHRELWTRIMAIRKEFFLSSNPAVIALVSGTLTYALPTDFFRCKRIRTTDANYQQIVWIGKDRSDPGFIAGQRSDISIAAPSEIFYDIDLQNIVVSPTPRMALNGSMDYYTLPTDPTAVIGFGVLDPFVSYIEMRAAARLLRKGGAGDPQGWLEDSEEYWKSEIMPAIATARQDQTADVVQSMFDTA